MRGSVVEVYQVFVGGRGGLDARPAVPVLDDVPRSQIGVQNSSVGIERSSPINSREAGRDVGEVGEVNCEVNFVSKWLILLYIM